MPTYTDTHRLVGHEFTINDPDAHPWPRNWSHGRCVQVTLSSARPGARVTFVRLRFPDGTERAYRPHEVRRALVTYPEARR